MGDLVSFCVSNHNYGRFLGPLIESLLHQTHDNVEIVVVDDGSTDESREVLSRYEGRIIVEYQDPARGQAEACNRAFALSHGAIVVFHDSDDIVDHDAAERLVNAFAAKEPVMVLSRLADIDSDGQPTGGMRPPDGCPLSGGDLRQLVLDRCAFFWTQTTGQAFRRSFLEQVLPIPTDLAPDMYLSHLGAIAAPVIALQAPIGRYRLHGLNKHLVPPSRGLQWLDQRIEYRTIVHDSIRRYGVTVGAFADAEAARRWAPRDYIMSSLHVARCRLQGQPGRWRHAVAGVRAISGHPQFRVSGQARHIAWFLGAAMLPRRMATRSIVARFPQVQ